MSVTVGILRCWWMISLRTYHAHGAPTMTRGVLFWKPRNKKKTWKKKGDALVLNSWPFYLFLFPPRNSQLDIMVKTFVRKSTIAKFSAVYFKRANFYSIGTVRTLQSTIFSVTITLVYACSRYARFNPLKRSPSRVKTMLYIKGNATLKFTEFYRLKYRLSNALQLLNKTIRTICKPYVHM